MCFFLSLRKKVQFRDTVLVFRLQSGIIPDSRTRRKAAEHGFVENISPEVGGSGPRRTRDEVWDWAAAG